MRLPIYHVDAFADAVFGGNPAAVVPLEMWLPDGQLQAIAAENNLSETAFLVPTGNGWEVRWFTPLTEIDLCGHATLAAAHVLAHVGEPGRDRFDFATRSVGRLQVTRSGERYTLDLPVRKAVPIAEDRAVLRALGWDQPVEMLAARETVVVLESEDQVRSLRPDMTLLADTARAGVIVTAPGDDSDFVSRSFAPQQGIPEDPVSGSAHCTLVPYWAMRYGRHELSARQVSSRGGRLWCRLAGDRVLISGDAALYLEGVIHV